MTNEALALKYAPVIYFDEKETIPLVAVGYSILRETGPSPSFSRTMPIWDAAFVIEYAYYWDYDIQHMYDLEHIWVWVGADGRVANAQASFHGRYLNTLLKEGAVKTQVDDNRIHIYCQPGKHAFLPHGQWFELVPDYRESCMENAGGGLLLSDMFAGKYATSPELDKQIDEYIKCHLAFEPSMRFVPMAPPAAIYQPWEALKELIPARINAEIKRVTEAHDLA